MQVTTHRLAGIDDLEEGRLRRVEVAGRALCLARMENGAFAAIDDLCTHEDESLSDGELLGSEIECPAHGARFDLQTGAATFPADTPATVHRIVLDGDDVLVELSD